jgi:hypothetical protein
VDTRYSASALPSTTSRDRRTPPWASFLGAVAGWKANLASLLYKTYVSLRSFRGHTGILFSRGGTCVDLGASFLERDGCYLENERTIACAEGIEKLKAIHPWIESVDVRIFLMGFAAGEEYCKIGLPDLNSQESSNE